MGLTVNILTSGFLVTVIIFFLLTGILFYSAYAKMGQVLQQGDSRNNNLSQLDSALKAIRVAYILAFIAAALSLILAILYAGHETVIKPSEYIHLFIFLAIYILLVVSVIYAYISLTKLYDVSIVQRNGADAFIWAGLLMSLFGFIGLTMSGTGRLGMNIVRNNTEKRVASVESKINEHLPAIRSQVETHLQPIRNQVEQTKAQVEQHLEPIRTEIEANLPVVRNKVDELHEASLGSGIVSSLSPSSISSQMNSKQLRLPKSQFQTCSSNTCI